MFGDTEIQPSVQPVDHPLISPPSASPSPIRAFIPPKALPAQVGKTSIVPLLIGFLIVIIIAAALGVVYYKNKLVTSSLASPTPSPIIVASDEPESSPIPVATPSASAPLKSSVPTPHPSSSTKPTVSSPTPTPVSSPSLDIRFGNPSGSIKQTIDEGKGDGRVINREYSSVQSGQFDEVPVSWSPRVTVCYHIVASEEILGKNLKFTFTLDDKVELEDNLGGYDKLEPGRIYDWCHDTTTNIGKHTARLLLNGDKSLKESNYANDLARVDWENLADYIAPNLTFGGPFDWGDKGTCFVVYAPSDNVNTVSELKVEQKVDNGSWSPIVDGTYCFKGDTGTTHNYAVHAIDTRGNVNEQTKSFVLY